ncbi:MAG TPA: Ig-like domain-containing protein [Mycobacteriales bacterium]|nr:Ig-like domain-containing protein [Mycobacteriales bacterium]
MLLGLSVLTLVGTTEVPAYAGGSSSPTITSSPASPTTATPLTWTFTSTATATSCELDRGGSVVSALADCTSGDPSATFDVSSQPGGSYTFTVFDADAADVDGGTASDSSTVDVAPVAPTVSLTTSSPNNSQTPAWTFDTPTGATDACELDDPDGHPIDTQSTCTSPYIGDLSGHDDGDYSLSVTATAGGVSGASDSASYRLDTTAPVAPTVTPPTPTGHDRRPTFRLTGLESGATLSCTATDPDDTIVAVGNCFGDSPTVQIPADGPDGEYSLSVSQTDVAGNVSTVGSGEYLLDTVAPPAPDVTAPANPSADRTPTFTVSDAEVGVSYQCSVDGPSTASVASCGSTATVDLAGADNGWYTLSVAAVDAAGNVSPVGTAEYLFDIPAPAPVVSGPATGQGRSPSFSVTDSQGGVAFGCTVSGPATVTVTSCGATSSLDLTGAPDGHYVLSVVATDSFGQDSEAGTATYVLDTTAPAAPVVTPPDSPGSTRHPDFAVSDAEDGMAFTCTVDGPSLVSVTACDAMTTLDLTGGVDGTYTVSVTATDPAGNISSATQSSYVLDTVPPPAPDVVIPASPSNDTSPTFGISDSESGVVLSCVLIDPDANTVFSGACPGSGSFDTLGSPDGTYDLFVAATDHAGNVTSTAVTWTRDTTPPPAPVVTAPASPSSDVIAGFTVTESDTTATLSCLMTASDGTVVLNGTCPPDGNVDTTGFVDGTFTFSVTAADAVGNTVTTTVTWTRDTTPPPAPTVTAPVSPSQDLTPQFQLADAESGATLNCVLLAPDGTTVSNGNCPSDGILNTGALHDGSGDGTYTLQVTAVDEVGNVSSTSSASYTLDTVAPPVPDVTAPAATGHSRMPTFTVTDTEPGVTYTCTVSGPTPATVADCDGSPVVDLSSAPDGTYTLSVTASDAAGNTSAAGSAGYLLDSIAPPAPTVTGPTSPAQGRTPTFTVTDPETNVTFSCTVTGPTPETISDCDGTPMLDLTGAAQDGTYTLSVTATDTAGNTSPAHSASYTLDTTAPPAPSIVAPPSPSFDTTPNFWISDTESDVTLSCVFTAPDGTLLVNGSCPDGGTFATTQDGLYTLTVTATDEAGNATPTTVEWTLDTTAPAAPVVTVPPSPGKTTSPSFGISDTDPSATLKCVLTSPGSRTVFTGACPVSGSFSTGGFGDGTYTLMVTATDPAGNVSATTTVHWVRDTMKPAAPVVTVVPSIGNSRSPGFTVTDADTTATFSCTTSPSVPVTCGATSTLDLTAAADGPYTLTVTAIDPAGNVSPAGSATYTLDTTPPPAPVVTSPASPSNKLAPVFPVSDTEPGVTYACSVVPAGVVVTRCPVLGGPASVKLNLAGDSDGTYTLSVTAMDAQGNISSAGTATYTLDTTAPATPVVVAPSSPSSNPKPVFGISEPGGDPSVTLGCVLVGPGSATIFSAPCPASGRFDTADDGDGTYVLTVTATDGAGNTSSASASYVLDTIAPSAPTVTVAGSPGNSDSVTFTYTAHESGTVLNCVLTYSDGTIISSSVCPASPGVFTVGSSGDGVYTLAVTATDAAGNISAPGHASYTLDTTAPPVPTVTPATSTGNSRTPAFTVSDTESGVTFTCSVVPSVPVTSCGASTGLNLAGQPDGSYILSVTATDAAVNVSSPGTATYVLDTTPPVTPVLSLTSAAGHVTHDPNDPNDPNEWTGSNATPTFKVAADGAGDPYTDQGLKYTCTPSASATVESCGATTQLGLSGDLSYTLTVTVTDAAGNVSAVSNTVTYILDTVAPDAPTVTPLSGSPSSNTDPFWEWSGGASEQFQDRLTATCTLIDPHKVATPVPCAQTASKPFQIPLKAVTGAYELIVTITDLAGNVSPPSVPTLDTTYTLDPKAFFEPTVFVQSPDTQPGRSRSPVWKVIQPPNTTMQCQLFRGDDQHGTPISSLAPCSGGTRSYSLAGLADGDYTLVVFAVQSDHTAATPVGAIYTLDTTPPHAPRLLHGTDGISSDITPEWTFELPPDASTGQCVWSRGDTVLFTQQHCQSETTFSLIGLGDGPITVRVYAFDAAGNRSQPLVITHILDRNPPGRPDVSPPSGDSATAVWTVRGDSGDSLTCTLLSGHHVVVSARSCGSHPTYQMGSLPSGTYTLSATQMDDLGVTSPAGTASWLWINGSGGGQPNPGGGGTGPVAGGGHHPSSHKHVVAPVALLPKLVQHVISKIGKAIKNPGPTIHKVIKTVVPVPGPVAHAVQSAVSAVGQAGGGTGFPLILVGLVIVFLIVQNRIDRRDPKLAFVSVAADDLVEFQPPPSQEDGA